MNSDPFTTFNYKTTNRDKAFKVTSELYSVMPHFICSDRSADQVMLE